MGRTRSFVEAEVVARCAAAFRSTGYEGTSIDDLVRVTGLHRGSLYKAFGSKRGIFLLALQRAAADAGSAESTDLLLVSLLELSPRDAEVRSLTFSILESAGRTPVDLGQRILDRASGKDTT